MQELISLIIPIYNGERYLKRCFNSIKQQEYENLEVILVNDGSTDSSLKLCEEFAGECKNCKVITIENQGPATARSIGLQNANGVYIEFMDCDDLLAPKAMNYLAEAMKPEYDMVVGTYIKIYEGYRVRQRNMERCGIYDAEEYIIHTLKDPGHFYYGVNWNKLYRKSVIDNNQLTFAKNINLGEDFVFNIHYLMKARKVNVISNQIYFYDCRENGLSRNDRGSLHVSMNEFKNRHLIWDEYVKCFKDLGLYEKYRSQMEEYWINYKVRQEYNMKHFFGHWPLEDKEAFRNTVETDSVINDCIAHLGRPHYRYRKGHFFFWQSVKDKVKKGMRIFGGEKYGRA